ncbi:MAG: hypothetical protein AAFP03_04755 [Cyanobacteria bacterium J06598_3]
MTVFALTAATSAFTPVFAPLANAAESKAVENIHATRIEQLSNSTKAVENIHATRWEQLANSTKAVENIHATRWEQLANSTKANSPESNLIGTVK